MLDLTPKPSSPDDAKTNCRPRSIPRRFFHEGCGMQPWRICSRVTPPNEPREIFLIAFATSLPNDAFAFARIVGVPLKLYVRFSSTY